MNCVLGLSGKKGGLASLPAALQEAQSRCRLHFYEPERWVFLHDPLGPGTIRHAETARMNFSKELFAQNYQEAFAIKNEVLRQIVEDCPTDLDAVKKLCSSKKVYEIAEEVGYSSLSYFSTAFKKSFGQTPAEYQAFKQKNKQGTP